MMRDFVDLYVICQREYSLKEVVDFFQKKFAIFNQDLHHIYKSLIYFEDAEEEEMPKMLENVEWEEIKRYFTEEVRKLVLN